MLKVCMVLHGLSNDNRVLRYADSLVEAGAQVDILCLDDAQCPFLLQRDGIRVFTIPVLRLRGSLSSYIREYGRSFVLFSVKLFQLFLRNRYQVIHVHNVPDFLVFTALFPKLFGAKIILDLHDPLPELSMSKYHCEENHPLVRFARLQEKLSAKFAHAVITANSNFEDNLVRRGIAPGKITVVYNLADPRYFDRKRYLSIPKHDPTKFTLIYPGSVFPSYGLDIAIRALELLIPEIPGIRLSIFGVSPMADIANLADRLHVSAYVQCSDGVPPDRLAGELLQADIGIYAALRDPHMDIAMPTKVLEYAAMGIPIISSRLKVLEDVFPESTISYFEPGNVEQFAGCVIDLYQHPERRRDLVEKMDDIYPRTFSWDIERQRYFSLINHLLIDRRGKEYLPVDSGAKLDTV